MSCKISGEIAFLVLKLLLPGGEGVSQTPGAVDTNGKIEIQRQTAMVGKGSPE